MAAMLLPMAASAHGLGLNLGGALDLGAGSGKDKTQVEGNGSVNVNANAHNGERDNDGDNDKGDKEIKNSAHASTTAAVITKKANRVQDVADFMGSIGTVIEAKLAVLGTTTPAVTSATADYKTQIAGAKIQAQSAITTASTINANNSTTTNAAIAAQAQTSLTAARDFLAAARADFKVMLNFLWH